ncbi:MAG: MBL fold metallo-hydrolase [Cellulosilyticaceae bacterium]
MNFRLTTIASGSSGNCTFLEAGQIRILIDAGISGKKVLQGLSDLEIEHDSIQGIFITHEHSDHIKGVGIISRKLNIPIYATKLTWEHMLNEQSLGKIAEENIKHIEKEIEMNIGKLSIKPYEIFHDAVDPVGYVFSYKDKKIALATDLGKVDRKLVENLYGVNGILLEFNHDINMLEVGPYPYSLKKRILGDSGHLSNELAAKVLTHIYHDQLQWVILGHLSKDNNMPDLAYITAKNALEKKNIYIGQHIEVTVANRDNITPMHNVLMD